MKIVLVSDYYPPHARGGSGQSASLLGSALAREQNIEVHILTPNYGGQSSYSQDGACHVHRYAFPNALGSTGAIRYRYSQNPVSYARAARQVAELVSREGPDLVAVQDYKFTAIGALLATRARRGVPLVLTIRDTSVVCPLGYCYMNEGAFRTQCSPLDVWRECSPGMMQHYSPSYLEHRSGSLRGRVNHVLLVGDTRMRRLTLGRVSGVIAISEALRKLHAERNLFRGLPSAVIPNIVEMPGPFTQHELSDVRRRLSLVPGRTVVFAPGKLSWGKGYEVLKASIPLVRRAIADVRVVCVGDTSETYVPAQTDALIVPRLSRMDLNRLLRAADVVVVPSIAFEGFGRICVEALACGTPVIASDAGGLPEILRGSGSGLVVPRGDCRELASAIVAVLSDSGYREAMGEEGRRLVAREYSAAAVSGETVRFFETVLS